MKDFAPKSIRKFTLEESGGMTSTAVEQANLGQYFTQRKGLEDVHPAKRRKVDMSGVEGEVAVRRSERSKKQAASFQSKISTRSSKASKRNAKVILKEKSVQTPAKERSDSTSLFDDHAYYKDPDIKPQTNLTSQQLMKFAWQIADGMSYLSSKSVS